MDALTAIAMRRSVRSYKQDPIARDTIEKILQAANQAPSAGDFHISVITDPGLLREINDTALDIMKNSGTAFLLGRAALPGYQPLYGAPLLLLFSAPAENPYSMANVSNAATTAVIAATSLELGTCYAITPTLPLEGNKDLSERAGVPAGLKALCGVLFGVPDGEKFASPRKRSDNVSWR